MDLSSTSQVSTLMREPARAGHTVALVPPAGATAGQAGVAPVAAPQTVQAAQPVEQVEAGHLPVPGSPEPTGESGERYDIEV